MKAHYADVVVHIDEALSPDRRSAVLDEMRHYEGVLDVEAHEERPHLFTVTYDADTTGSQALLAKIKSDGLHAELVGL